MPRDAAIAAISAKSTVPEGAGSSRWAPVSREPTPINTFANAQRSARIPRGRAPADSSSGGSGRGPREPAGEESALQHVRVMVLFSHPMPELPDVTVYVEHLERLLKRDVLRKVRLASPFVLRSVQPPLRQVEGRRLTAVSRLGKRIVFSFEEDLFLVLHLMIAGRLRWREAAAAIPKKLGLLAMDFDAGTLLLTEASAKKRAWIRLVAGEDALTALDPGGLEPLEASPEAFAARLQSENHTLKRTLTDPTLFSGFGNAYSDEILHRAKLSPVALTSRLSDAETAFPRRSRRSGRRWPCTASTANRAPPARPPSSASSTPTTKRTTARRARRAPN